MIMIISIIIIITMIIIVIIVIILIIIIIMITCLQLIVRYGLVCFERRKLKRRSGGGTNMTKYGNMLQHVRTETKV